MRTLTTSVCENCTKEFSLRLSDKNRGRGRFCGKSCAASGKHSSSYVHGHSVGGQTKEYRTWAEMKVRTTNPKAQNYPYYGGRGIKVCARWFNSFPAFLSDMGEAPSASHSIDRIDGDRDYEPSNCRWATRMEQMSNIRSNKLLTHDGVTLTQEEWGRRTGLGGLTILKRLKRGWSVERALTTPKQS